MIQNIIKFFKEDKWTFVVFILVIAAIAYSSMKTSASQAEKFDPRNSEAIQEFKAAEEELHNQVKELGSVANFLKANPRIAVLFNLMTFGVLGVFIIGVVILINWIFSPELREKVALSPPAESVDWRFSMIFKVILYFIFIGGLLSIASEGIKFLGVHIPMNMYMVFHTTLIDILVVYLIYSVVKARSGNWSDIGFRLLSKDAWKEVKIGFMAYLAVLPIFMGVLIALVVISKLISYEPPSHPLVTVFLEEEKRSLWLVSFSIFLAVFVGPVIEEIFFRGFCYPILRKNIGKFAAMVVTALFFSLVHGNVFAFFPIFILGIALAYVYEMRHSLVAPMIIHVTHNLAFITYFFLAKKVVYQIAG